MTMRVRHTFTAHGRCPVNDDIDFYTVVVETDRVLEVHAIVAKARELLATPMFQEDFTQQLSQAIGTKVTTTGRHGHVHTEVTV